MDMSVQNKNMYLLRLASEETKLYYDADKENLYVVSETIVYKYANITFSVWQLISQGDDDFFESTVMNMPYRIVAKVPQSAYSYTYTLPVPTVVMYSVKSSNVAYVGYDAKKRRLYAAVKTAVTEEEKSESAPLTACGAPRRRPARDSRPARGTRGLPQTRLPPAWTGYWRFSRPRGR